MSKVLVMYFSKYGHTKKYAEWIALELNGDIYNIKNIKSSILKNYDAIILGSGLYAGKIEGINIIINNYEALKNQQPRLKRRGMLVLRGMDCMLV
jgi:menaquinone-dependent protoporphyrinogen IX oxidase